MPSSRNAAPKQAHETHFVCRQSCRGRLFTCWGSAARPNTLDGTLYQPSHARQHQTTACHVLTGRYSKRKEGAGCNELDVAHRRALGVLRHIDLLVDICADILHYISLVQVIVMVDHFVLGVGT